MYPCGWLGAMRIIKAMIDNYPEACEDDGNTDNEMVQR
jgi:hypothetical protein